MARKQTKRPPEFGALQKIAEPFVRRLYFVGILTKYLATRGVRPIIVGGNAVEFYTLGAYATGDIDLICSDRKALGDLLQVWGFRREGRTWFDPDLDLYLEAPSEVLAPEEDPGRVTEADVRGLTVRVVGIEDLIIDRLNAYVYWKSAHDGVWAQRLMIRHADSIDWTYLRKRARQQGVADALTRLKRRKAL
jgi:predicted nucleotidyltransferase